MNHPPPNIRQQIIKALEDKDYQTINEMKLSDEEAKWMFQQQRFLGATEEIDKVVAGTLSHPIPALVISALTGSRLQASLKDFKNYTSHYLDELSAWLLPSSNSLAYTRNNSNQQKNSSHNSTDISEVIKTKYFSVTSADEKVFEIIFSKEVKQINIEKITTSTHEPFSLTEQTSGKDCLTPVALNSGNYRLEIRLGTNNQEVLELVLKSQL